MTKFETKKALFGYSRARILKNYFDIWNQHLQICLIANFCEETKKPKFGTKSASFRYFWQKTIAIFEISTLKFVRLKNFAKKQKSLNFRTNIGYFWTRVLENYRHIWDQHLRLRLIGKFCGEIKMPKIGTQKCHFGVFLTYNALFGCFWARVFKKTIVLFQISKLEFV